MVKADLVIRVEPGPYGSVQTSWAEQRQNRARPDVDEASPQFSRLGDPAGQAQEDAVALSARNQLKGRVKSVKLGTVMAEVVVQVGENEIVSAITRGSAERLELSEGTAVTVVIKATEVLLSTDST
jgi:molybdopterin-binding protein